MATATVPTAAPSAPKPQPRYIEIELGDIAPSPFNHRRTFRGLEELAESIRTEGVLQAVTVRPMPAARAKAEKLKAGHELVLGERRWRGSEIAGKTTIPAIVREMTDAEVIRAQLIENVQRSDVHPLEEADGYKDLLDKHGYTVEQLVAEIGKSKAYIYARLKLCDLAPVPRKAFLEDKLNASVALLIARIPDAKLQAQATEEVLGKGGRNAYDGVEPEEVVKDGADTYAAGETQPLSVRAATVHVIRRYMLALDKAPFALDDATLVPKAGACTGCLLRTGNQRELFSDVKRADVCTNPPCFEQKRTADWERRAKDAAAKGLRVLNNNEVKKVFPYEGNPRVAHDAAYVDPDGELPYELNPGTKAKTWKQVLGKLEPAKVIARDPLGDTRELLDKKSAIAALTKAGKLKELKTEARASSGGRDAYRDQEAKRQRAAKLRAATGRAAIAKIVEQAGDTVAWWRWLAESLVDMIDSEDQKAFCRRRRMEFSQTGNGSQRANKVMEGLIAKATTLAELRALVVEIAVSFRAIGGPWSTDGYGKSLKAAAALCKIDLKKLQAQVAKEKKEAKAAAPAKAKKGKGARG